jgi:hypothetical protein
MLSGRLVRMIEDHADQLTKGLIFDIKHNPRTPDFQKFQDEQLYHRLYYVYHNLGEWLAGEGEELAEARYTNIGKSRAAEGIPLSEVLYVLIQSKTHLLDYIGRAGMFESAVELYQHEELRRLVDTFFDKAVYYTSRAYEDEFALHHTPVLAG